jgi:hypothetical protein
MHLLGKGGKGVTICTTLTMMERSELLRIETETYEKGTFSSQNFMREAYENVKETTRSKRKEIIHGTYASIISY